VKLETFGVILKCCLEVAAQCKVMRVWPCCICSQLINLSSLRNWHIYHVLDGWTERPSQYHAVAQ